MFPLLHQISPLRSFARCLSSALSGHRARRAERLELRRSISYMVSAGVLC